MAKLRGAHIFFFFSLFFGEKKIFKKNIFLKKRDFSQILKTFEIYGFFLFSFLQFPIFWVLYGIFGFLCDFLDFF